MKSFTRSFTFETFVEETVETFVKSFTVETFAETVETDVKNILQERNFNK